MIAQTRGLIASSGFSDSEKMAQYLEEERHMREENLRLQRKLQREMERREALCRQLSESESSLEMDDERFASLPLPVPPPHHIYLRSQGIQGSLTPPPSRHQASRLCPGILVKHPHA